MAQFIEKQACPFWIVNARTDEFIAGIMTEEQGGQEAAKLNKAAVFAGTPDRYRVMPKPKQATAVA